MMVFKNADRRQLVWKKNRTSTPALPSDQGCLSCSALQVQGGPGRVQWLSQEEHPRGQVMLWDPTPRGGRWWGQLQGPGLLATSP